MASRVSINILEKTPKQKPLTGLKRSQPNRLWDGTLPKYLHTPDGSRIDKFISKLYNDSGKVENIAKEDKRVNGIEKVVKHLEMTQTSINRLGTNSFLAKGGSVPILVAAMVLVSKEDLPNSYINLLLFLPVAGFWVLDGYYLWQERLFRQVYEEIRQQDDTDFKMDLGKHKNKAKCSWGASIFSVTLVIFYLIEAAFVGAIAYFT